ncbi:MULTISPECIES: NRDE family protein [Anaeromyxobacter]|uniref:NRDE family protein n=1 Tax=Anaeromyxobacter TaxID=161492 RepID=UPI001F58998F|nr:MULTISPECIES: NRDE family protein [unclassified Anaeromyxobacter]
MCTLAVALGTDRRWPVVVAANRDERLGRPSEGWALRALPGGERYAAPLDALGGGTWIGLSRTGVVAALTNYHAPLDWYPDLARRSRGELVPLALAAGSAEGARAAFGAVRPDAWNPFHLVVADARSAFLWWYDGERAGVEALGPGLHVVTENAWDGRCPRAALVRARWPLDPGVERLREVLTVHAPEGDPVPPRGAAASGAATCIHMDPAYGTRSSTVLRLTRELATSELWTADARPCLGPLEDRSSLAVALARTA